MRNRKLLWGGMLLCASLAVVLLFVVLRSITTTSEPLLAANAQGTSATASAPQGGEPVDWDQPGPYLQIVVSGTANGTVTIDLAETLAPGHVAQIIALAESGAYNNVVFHRVIDGFMAQTGDVQFGKSGQGMGSAGMGGSDRADLKAEFSKIPFDRGIVGMARSQSPDSANSQFFIMFDQGYFLNEQYTVIGRVTGGMDIVDKIKRGAGQSGTVKDAPDVMTSVTVTR